MISLQRLSPNASLVGKTGARHRLMTPCLVLDRLALRRNITRMADICREAGVALRPHAKTHKSVEIARMQVEAGAVGIAVASLGEAEVMVEGGIGDVLITSILAPNKFDRLIALTRSGAKLAVAVDNLDGARALDDHLTRAGAKLDVYLDVDMGRQRSGVPDAARALELAQFLNQSASFTFRGLQAYAGHASHVEDFTQRAAEIEVADRKLDAIRDALTERGIAIERISGVSTGSLLIDIARKRFNEMQCGSYIVMDAEYNAVALDPDGRRLFEPSLFVRASVISQIVPGRATVDAGHKHFAGTAAPVVSLGAPSGAELRPNSDEHGFLTYPPGDTVSIGDAVEAIPPHCDPTINLYSHYHVVEGDDLVAIWPVDARGAF